MICIQDLSVMAKKGERDLDNVVLSLRLRGAEAVRFWRLMDAAKQRNAYSDRTDVIRELLELDAANLLAKTEIDFFRTGDKATEIIFVPKPKQSNEQKPKLKRKPENICRLYFKKERFS